MKANLRNLLALALFMAALGGMALAQGYDHDVRAKIPLSFYAGGKLQPAGTYTFTINLQSHNIAMVSRDKNAGLFLHGVPEDGSKNGAPVLTFHTKGGDVYILQEIQWADFGTSFNVKKVLADVGENRSVDGTTTVLAQLIR